MAAPGAPFEVFLFMTTTTKATQAKATQLIAGWVLIADEGELLATLDTFDIASVHRDTAKGCTVVSMRAGWWLGFDGITVKDVTAAIGEAVEHRRAEAAGKRSQKRDAKRPQPRTGTQ
jgi:hypothetical protein